MAKVCRIVLIVVLLASMGTSAPDWVSDLTRNINANVNQYVEQVLKDVNAQIENSVRPAIAEANRVIENLPRDAHGRIISNGHVITNGGNIISLTSANGITKTVMSGHTSDGEPYVRNIEERNDGRYLYHNETSFNPRTNSSEKIRWKLDITTPGANPEIITDE